MTRTPGSRPSAAPPPRTAPRWALTFYLTGSAQTAQQAQERLALLASGKDFRAEKQARYDALLSQSRLEVPDEHFRQVWDWVKVNTDWLIVDSAPYGRALSAGMPEYPWWFGCDNCYACWPWASTGWPGRP